MMLKKKTNARPLFFILAATWAAIAPWFLLLTFTGFIRLNFTIQDHAHSMLYGFVGALIVGYLLGNRPKYQLYLIAGLWLISRLSEIFSDQQSLTQMAYSLYGLIIVFMVAPKFLAAKKLTNWLMVPILALIGLFPILQWLMLEAAQQTINYDALVLIIVSLLFFMGGRIITPLLSKAFATQGQTIGHRVQPKIELLTLLCLLSAALLILLEINGDVNAYLCLIAAILIITRIVRWQPHKIDQENGYIYTLCLGYLMLAIGLIFYAIYQIKGQPISNSLHLITIGALGTLSSTVMLKTSYQKSGLANYVYFQTTGLIIIASILRYSYNIVSNYNLELLLMSGICWSIAFAKVGYYVYKAGKS